MRPSMASSRSSYAAGLSTNPAAESKLLEKKKEFDAVSALEKASTLLLQRIEGLGEDCDIMADAAQVHGQVLEQWPKMFEILNLFLVSREPPVSNEYNSETPAPVGERLVRIPIDDLQTGEGQS